MYNFKFILFGIFYLLHIYLKKQYHEIYYSLVFFILKAKTVLFLYVILQKCEVYLLKIIIRNKKMITCTTWSHILGHLGCFEAWVVLRLGRFVFWTFWSWDVLRLGTF